MRSAHDQHKGTGRGVTLRPLPAASRASSCVPAGEPVRSGQDPQGRWLNCAPPFEGVGAPHRNKRVLVYCGRRHHRGHARTRFVLTALLGHKERLGGMTTSMQGMVERLASLPDGKQAEEDRNVAAYMIVEVEDDRTRP